jgi:cation diffusion facilitator family transporter
MTTCSLETSSNTCHGERQEKATFVVNLGLGFNALLMVVKISAGIFGHSQALLADGINSLSDVAYFLIVKIFIGLSGKPADSEHPYGHYQYETIAALVIGAFVITTGFAIFWDSVNTAFDIMTGKLVVQAVRSFTLYVAVATILVKTILMIQARYAGRTTKNIAVIAISRDHRNDIFASLGVAIGIGLSITGFIWADPLAGAIVAIIVAKTGFDILREATDELMDDVPGKELSEQIRGVLADESRILRIEEIHSHRFGPYLVANITICIDGSMSVTNADVIATDTEKKLCARIDMLRKVYIHTHPVNALKTECSKSYNSG